MKAASTRQPFFPSYSSCCSSRALPRAFLKLRKKKPATSGDTDLDDYEFPEDDEEDEAK